jgi:ADP-ribosyl-[dinitrogen reductase] hydrolase
MGSGMELEDRIVGCVLGGALGDAWGGPFEGAPSGFDFVAPARGLLSDDTHLTLATCEAIITARKVDPATIAAHLLARYRAGDLRGLGASTLKSLRDLDAGAHWALAGARGEHAAGNGAAMRAAVLGFLLDATRASDRTALRDVCRITHHSDEAYAGALAMVTAIQLIAQGVWPGPTRLLTLVASELPDTAVRDRLELLADERNSVAEIGARLGASGHVVESVPLALFAAQAIEDQPFEVVVAGVIRAGGDTDTTASLAGQVCGAVVGRGGISSTALDRVERISEVCGLASRFAQFVAGLRESDEDERPL